MSNFFVEINTGMKIIMKIIKLPMPPIFVSSKSSSVCPKKGRENIPANNATTEAIIHRS